ncbi:hypothetical protein KIPB_008067, partial [Kipferlia bialata]
LDLTLNPIGMEGASALADTLILMPHVTRLSISPPSSAFPTFPQALRRIAYTLSLPVAEREADAHRVRNSSRADRDAETEAREARRECMKGIQGAERGGSVPMPRPSSAVPLGRGMQGRRGARGMGMGRGTGGRLALGHASQTPSPSPLHHKTSVNPDDPDPYAPWDACASAFSATHSHTPGGRAVVEGVTRYRQGEQEGELSFKSQSIGYQGCLALVQCLPVLSGCIPVHALNLWGCDIDDRCLSALSPILPSVMGLKKLHLGLNCIGPEGIACLAETLSTMPHLEQLDLWRSRVGDAGACSLAEALEGMRGLTRLNLGWNGVGSVGGSAVASGLTGVPSITHLSLAGNSLGDYGCAAIADTLPSLRLLRELNLSCNRIGDQGAQALAAALPQTQALRSLDLGANGLIRAKGGNAMVHALRVTPRLTSFTHGITAAGLSTQIRTVLTSSKVTRTRMAKKYLDLPDSDNCSSVDTPPGTTNTPRMSDTTCDTSTDTVGDGWDGLVLDQVEEVGESEGSEGEGEGESVGFGPLVPSPTCIPLTPLPDPSAPSIRDRSLFKGDTPIPTHTPMLKRSQSLSSLSLTVPPLNAATPVATPRCGYRYASLCSPSTSMHDVLEAAERERRERRERRKAAGRERRLDGQSRLGCASSQSGLDRDTHPGSPLNV